MNYEELTQKELELYKAKNKDYTQGGDPYGNFKRVSTILSLWGIHLPPYTVALVYMMKQVDAMGRMLGEGYEGETESIESRLMDISIYAKILILLRQEGLRIG